LEYPVFEGVSRKNKKLPPPDAIKSDDYEPESEDEDDSLEDVAPNKPRSMFASGVKTNGDEDTLAGRSTTNGTPLADQPQYMQYKWDGTMVNDEEQTVTYLTVLISLPSGLIKSKGTKVNLKGKVTITINREGTVLYVQTNWPRSMYDIKLIQSAQKIIFSGIDGTITESNFSNVMLGRMGAVKELVATRELLGIDDTDAINTVAKIPLKYTCVPDVKLQTSVSCTETGGVFLLVNLLIADSIKQSRTSNCGKHASV
jgi:hypothetical protein